MSEKKKYSLERISLLVRLEFVGEGFSLVELRKRILEARNVS